MAKDAESKVKIDDKANLLVDQLDVTGDLVGNAGEKDYFVINLQNYDSEYQPNEFLRGFESKDSIVFENYDGRDIHIGYFAFNQDGEAGIYTFILTSTDDGNSLSFEVFGDLVKPSKNVILLSGDYLIA